MADPAPDTGGLLGFFDRGYDPRAAYEGLLSERPTKDALMARSLAAMAGAFGQGAMPSPYKGGTPFLATLGQAAQAAYAGQDELMKARNLAAEQQLHYAQAGLATSQMGITKLLGPAWQEYLKKYGVGGAPEPAAADKTGGPASLLATPTGASILNMTPPPADAGVPVDPNHVVGTDYLNTLAQAAAPHALPAGYTVEMTSGVRPNATVAGTGGRSQHADANAGDFVIKDDKGNRIPNTGEDTTGHYGKLALTMRMLADPMIKPRLAWGGNFTTGGDNAPKDLMHFDLGGDRGRYGTLAAMETAYTANLARNAPDAAKPVAAGGLLTPPPAGGVPGVDTPYAAAAGPTPPPIPPAPAAVGAPTQLVPPSATPISTGGAPVGGGLLSPDMPPRPAGRLGGVAQALAQGAMPPSLIADTGPGGPPGGGGLPGVDTPYATSAPPPPPAAPTVPSLLTSPGPAAPTAPPLPGAPTAAGPPAAGGMPPLPPAPVMPPIPTTMSPVGAPPPIAPTPQQGLAMGIAGLSALAKIPAPPFIQDMAKMPAQMALEQYKAWVGAVANMQGEAYKKQVEIAGAQAISAGQAAGKYPYDLKLMNATQAAELQKELALKGLYRDPITGQTIGLPGFNEAMAAQERAKAAAVAEAQQATKLEQIEREQRERGQQARLTARDEATNKPVLIPGVGLVVPGQLPGFNYQSVDAAVPNVAGPGGAPPAPGAQTSSDVLFKTQSEPQKAFLDANIATTKEQLKEYHTQQAAAPEQIGTADMIEKLIPATQFGWGEDTKVQGAMILKRLGVSDKDLKEYLGVNVAAAGDLSKLFLRFSTAAVREMGAREPGSVIGLFVRNFPSLESDPDTARTMTNVLRMQAQYQQDRGAAAMRYANEQQRNAGIHGENYTGMNLFLENFDKTNPMRDYTRAAAAMSGYREMGQETHGVLKGLAWNGINRNEDDMKRVVRLIPQGHQYVGPDGNIWNR